MRKLMRLVQNSPPLHFLWQGVNMYLTHRISRSAAGLAYFVLLALFPILICMSYLLGLASIDIAQVVAQLAPVLPEDVLVIVRSYLMYISYHQTPALFVAGLAACWFSAAAAYRTVAQVVLDVFDYVPRSPLRNLVVSIVFPLVLVGTLYLSIIVVVTGGKTLQTITHHFPFLVEVLDLWHWMRYVLLFAIFFLFILGVLMVASPRHAPRTPMLVSSLLATMVLLLASSFFAWFIGLTSRYSLIYGSLVSIIILLVWLYLCGLILFLALVFTSVWYKNRRSKKGPSTPGKNLDNREGPIV